MTNKIRSVFLILIRLCLAAVFFLVLITMTHEKAWIPAIFMSAVVVLIILPKSTFPKLTWKNRIILVVVFFICAVVLLPSEWALKS